MSSYKIIIKGESVGMWDGEDAAAAIDAFVAASVTAELVGEGFDERLARLEIDPGEFEEDRLGDLRGAHDAGVDDATLSALAAPRRAMPGTTIRLPAHHYEGLSRGRGWCKKGSGPSVEWGTRADGGGYIVGEGRWEVGGDDGFRRKGKHVWVVRTIRFGDLVWTVAD